jgi:hypothetical protein
MPGSLAGVFFCNACKPLIKRWFLGVFRFAKNRACSIPQNS